MTVGLAEKGGDGLLDERRDTVDILDSKYMSTRVWHIAIDSNQRCLAYLDLTQLYILSLRSTISSFSAKVLNRTRFVGGGEMSLDMGIDRAFGWYRTPLMRYRVSGRYLHVTCVRRRRRLAHKYVAVHGSQIQTRPFAGCVAAPPFPFPALM